MHARRTSEERHEQLLLLAPEHVRQALERLRLPLQAQERHHAQQPQRLQTALRLRRLTYNDNAQSDLNQYHTNDATTTNAQTQLSQSLHRCDLT